MKKMKKTTLQRCQKCKYFYGRFGPDPVCGYFKFSGKRKQSPIGYCDEFEPQVGERRKVSITLMI